jgi:hypothetical protein
MTEPESEYDRLRRAQRELELSGREVVKPIEETDEAEAAVEDEAPLPGLNPDTGEDKAE